MAEVVIVDYRVSNEADDDWRDEEELFDLVFADDVQHAGHGEGGEHVDFGVDEDGEVEAVDEACDVEEWEDGEDFLVGFGRYLLDLKALSYHVLMGYHDLETDQLLRLRS